MSCIEEPDVHDGTIHREQASTSTLWSFRLPTPVSTQVNAPKEKGINLGCNFLQTMNRYTKVANDRRLCWKSQVVIIPKWKKRKEPLSLVSLRGAKLLPNRQNMNGYRTVPRCMPRLAFFTRMIATQQQSNTTDRYRCMDQSRHCQSPCCLICFVWPREITG